MLTLGNVHKVVPKGANSGLNGNSVQPTGVVPKRCFDPSPEYKFAVILGPSLEMISIAVKALLFVLGKKNRLQRLDQTAASQDAIFFVLREGSNSGLQS
jgi:hypothetical protein